MMYEIWYDYVNPKYVKKKNYVIWIYMDTDHFIVCIKVKNIYVDIKKVVQARFDCYETINQTDHYRKEKICYLTENDGKDKKQKAQKLVS